MRVFLVGLAVAVLSVAGCQSVPESQAPLRATAQLKPTKGSKTFGEVTFEQIGSKVHVVANVQGLQPGRDHGFHIHEAGDCSSDDGMSTKGHFNPHGKPHGHPNSSERHAGDLPSLTAAKNGRAKIDFTLDVVTVAPGTASVVGRGIIVHADPDDYKTQPTGNAGARIACGVIRAD
jgi:Cu-Zn family superoxide dismutase